ncbi:hypothetical protein FN846DRAFT_902355 [Sphaerosporella brunnea]|uniref:Uncharacterized protein n=1 Tax=Sphaerosporella brunnea TaxID=1250544 RepID=A0A5J5FB32_9PEZI|nr:hypothetical protein FN846DRAFT_902355 [Sphaerosporella brunnea]
MSNYHRPSSVPSPDPTIPNRDHNRRGSHPRDYQAQNAHSYGTAAPSEHWRARSGYSDPNHYASDDYGPIPKPTGAIVAQGFTGQQASDYYSYKEAQVSAGATRGVYTNQLRQELQSSAAAWGSRKPPTTMWNEGLEPDQHEFLLPAAADAAREAQRHYGGRRHFAEQYPITLDKGHRQALKDSRNAATKSHDNYVMHESSSSFRFPRNPEGGYPGRSNDPHHYPDPTYRGVGSEGYTRQYHSHDR